MVNGRSARPASTATARRQRRPRRPAVSDQASQRLGLVGAAPPAGPPARRRDASASAVSRAARPSSASRRRAPPRTRSNGSPRGGTAPGQPRRSRRLDRVGSATTSRTRSTPRLSTSRRAGRRPRADGGHLHASRGSGAASRRRRAASRAERSASLSDRCGSSSRPSLDVRLRHPAGVGSTTTSTASGRVIWLAGVDGRRAARRLGRKSSSAARTSTA